MTEVDPVARSGQPAEPAGLTARPLTLAEEHVLLLWQVTASAEKLLTATEHGRWPGAELAALAGYAQAEVMRVFAADRVRYNERTLSVTARGSRTVASQSRRIVAGRGVSLRPILARRPDAPEL